MNILITSAGRKVWLIKAFQEAGAHVIACDLDPLAPALYVADEKMVGNPSEICKCYDAIVPTRDAELLNFSTQFSNAIVSKSEAIIHTFKCNFNYICKINNFPFPVTIPPKMYFVKPLVGAGSRGVSKIDGINNIIQEFIDWPEYTIDVFIHPNGTPISAVPRERIKIINGESWTSKTVKCPALIDASLDLCSKIGLIWHSTVQAFYNGKDIKFIEVMNRFGGGAPLSFAAGANSPMWIVDILKGKKVKPHIGEYVADLTMAKYTEEVFF